MNTLTIIEHKGTRVLTTQQLADVYETETNSIHQNYLRNQDRFAEGRDYYKLEGAELVEFKRLLTNSQEPSIKFAPQLILWTERGANRHSKILDTDKAWQQFDLLEETYFNAKSGKALPAMTQAQVIAAVAQQAAEQEQRMLALSERQEKTEKTLQLVKDTFANRDDDNWRDSINAAFAKIVKSSGIDYRTIKTESYQLLEDRAGCRLSVRVKNAKDRLQETGATMTAIRKFCNLDAIEQEPRLKEIYTTIVKEMTIRYVA